MKIEFCGHLLTRIKDAGIAIRHAQGYMVSLLQGLEMGLSEWTWCVSGPQNMLTLSKDTFL